MHEDKKKPHKDELQEFIHRVRKSVNKAFKVHHPDRELETERAVARAGNVGTDIVTVPIVPRVAGTYQFDGGAVPANLQSLTVAINLNDADKLAVGNSMILRSLFSLNGGTSWLLGNQTTWNSYGPGGFTVTDPDGTVRVNPDPRLQIGLTNRAGQLLRGEIVLPQALPAGATLSLK
jgi:hypothetical protein